MPSPSFEELNQKLQQLKAQNPSSTYTGGPRPSLDEIFGTTSSVSVKPQVSQQQSYPSSTNQSTNSSSVNTGGIGAVLQGKLQGNDTKIEPLKKFVPPPSPLGIAALGAAGPALIEGAANPATLRPDSPVSKLLGENNAQGLNNFNAQGIASATDALANTVDFITNPKSAMAQSFEQSNPALQEPSWIKSVTNPLTQNIRKESNQRNETDENSLSTTLGDVTGSIVGSLPAMAAVDSLVKASPISEKALENSSNLNKIAGFLARSGINTASTTIPTEGKLPNAQELGSGALIDTIFHGSEKVLDKLGSNLFEKIVPTTITQAASDAKKGLDIGEALSKDGISLTRESAMQKAKQRIGGLSSKLDQAILDADNQFGLIKPGSRGAVQTQDLINNLREEVLTSPKLKAQFGDTKSINKALDNVIEEFNTVVGDKAELTYAETQNLKKKLGGGLGSFFDKVDNAAKAKDIANDVIRKRAQKIIEDAIPEAKKINQEIAPLIVATNRAAKKGAYKGLLYDLIAGSGYATYEGATGQAHSPEDYVKNLIIGGLTRRAGKTTFAKTAAGTTLKTLAENTPEIDQIVKIIMNKELFSGK